MTSDPLLRRYPCARLAIGHVVAAWAAQALVEGRPWRELPWWERLAFVDNAEAHVVHVLYEFKCPVCGAIGCPRLCPFV